MNKYLIKLAQQLDRAADNTINIKSSESVDKTIIKKRK